MKSLDEITKDLERCGPEKVDEWVISETQLLRLRDQCYHEGWLMAFQEFGGRLTAEEKEKFKIP